jgi:hypothetical protein
MEPVWWASSRAMCMAVLAFTLVNGRVTSAQDFNPAPQTNDVAQAEEMGAANDNGQGQDMVSGDENVETNSAAETNDQAAGPGEDARARRLRRQRMNRSRNLTQPNGVGQSSSGTNSGPGALDYSAFRIVADRNIFDPNRFPRSTPDKAPSKAADSFGLVGTMSYEKGDFAFFDGTRPDYKKVLKVSDTIAGYKVLAVLPDSVKLARSTNELVMTVGGHLRRQDDGTWVQASSPAAYDAAPVSSSSSAQPETASSGGESDIIKRMMQRREKE